MVQKHLVENHRKWEGLIMRIMMDDGNCNGDRSDNDKKDNHMIMIIVTILIIIIILNIIKSVVLQYDNDDNDNRNQANKLQKEVYPLGNQRRAQLVQDRWCTSPVVARQLTTTPDE